MLPPVGRTRVSQSPRHAPALQARGPLPEARPKQFGSKILGTSAVKNTRDRIPSRVDLMLQCAATFIVNGLAFLQLRMGSKKIHIAAIFASTVRSLLAFLALLVASPGVSQEME